MPAKGGWAGAGRGAVLGASAFLHGGACVGVGCGAIVLLAPVGAVVGAIAGAAAAEPAPVVEQAEAILQAVFSDLKIPDALGERIVQGASAETHHALVLECDAAAACATAKCLAQCTDAIGTVLQINIQGYGTKARWDINPPVFLFLDTDVRLSRPADGTVIYSRKFAWVSAGRPLAEWASANGDPVREELGRGIQYLAARIVDVVFLLKAIP